MTGMVVVSVGSIMGPVVPIVRPPVSIIVIFIMIVAAFAPVVVMTEKVLEIHTCLPSLFAAVSSIRPADLFKSRPERLI